MYLKRQKAPKSWPVERKGTAYLVKPNSNLSQGIPVLVLLRDILKVAQNRREVKRIIHNKHLMLNQRLVKDEKDAAVLFDTITLVPSDKSYRVDLSSKGKFELKEIPSKESGSKISKVVNKKVLKGKKVQINLSDGRNFISNVNCNVGDSVLINLKDKKIEKAMPFKEKETAIAFAGKHAGSKGIIEKIDLESKIVGINVGENKINVLMKQLMVI